MYIRLTVSETVVLYPKAWDTIYSPSSRVGWLLGVYALAGSWCCFIHANSSAEVPDWF